MFTKTVNPAESWKKIRRLRSLNNAFDINIFEPGLT